MNDILLNIFGCGSIAAMLFAICAMWHNINKQLSLIEKTSALEKALTVKNGQKSVKINNATRRIKNTIQTSVKRNTGNGIRTAGRDFSKSPELYYTSSKA